MEDTESAFAQTTIPTNIHTAFGEITYRYGIIAPIAQLVSALDFNFDRAVEGSILTVSKRLSLKNLNVIIRATNSLV